MARLRPGSPPPLGFGERRARQLGDGLAPGGLGVLDLADLCLDGVRFVHVDEGLLRTGWALQPGEAPQSLMTFGNTMPKVRMQTASLRMKTTFWRGFICLNGTPSCFGCSMSDPHCGLAVYDKPPVAPLRQADCAGSTYAVAGCFSTRWIVPARLFLLYGLVT